MTPPWSQQAVRRLPNPRVRIAVVGLLLGGLLVAIAVRLWMLQGPTPVRARWLGIARANERWAHTPRPRRGRILDRHGDPLAISVRAYSVAARPAEVKDPDLTAELLGRVLGVPAASIEARLRAPGAFRFLARRVPDDVALSVKGLQRPGILLETEWKREHPLAPLAARVLGRVHIDGGGTDGVERALDAWLAPWRAQPDEGKHWLRGFRLQGGRDVSGRPFLAPPLPDPLFPVGFDVELTLDATVQAEAEAALDDAVRTHHARRALAIALDISTGEILALAYAPRPGAGADPSDPSAWKNWAINEVHEPGSTFKVVTLYAALASHAVRLDDVFDASAGVVRVAGVPIRDAHRAGRVTALEALAVSSNVAFVRIAQRTGRKAMLRAIEALGLTQPTGVELPGERVGRTRHLASCDVVTFATAAFGQGVSVTPMQLLRAVATLAGDGRLVRPTLVHRVLRPDGSPLVLPQSERGPRVVDARAAHQVLRAMRAVVEDPHGTGRRAALDEWAVAGKTGTAQKVEPGRGYVDRWMGWFVGVLPAEAPRLAVLVVVDEPEGHGYGGVVAAPAFRRIARAAAERLGVPRSVPRPIGRANLAELRRVHASLPAGPPAPQPPAPAGEVVPKLVGLPARVAIERAARAGLRAHVGAGMGFVVAQDPPAGAARPDSGQVRLTLGPVPSPPPSADSEEELR